MLNLLISIGVIICLSLLIFHFAKNVYIHQKIYQSLLFNITKKYREVEREKLKYNKLVYRYQNLLNYKKISEYGKINDYIDLKVDNVSIIYKAKK